MAVTGGVAFAPSALGCTKWVTQPPLGQVLPASVLQPWGVPGLAQQLWFCPP